MTTELPLQGVPEVKDREQEAETVITPLQANRYKKILESHFQVNRPYLDCEYSLEKLVLDMGIPRYVLSAFINREYGMGFRELLNRYRVTYFRENLGKPEWDKFTLEAIGRECGFSNRVSFFRNVKQITGETPTNLQQKVSGKGEGQSG